MRPKDITEETSIVECEKWRSQVLRDLDKKLEKINDPALTDYQIRDLNDEINKLQKEKHAWEMHLRKLGGPNYLKSQGAIDSTGRVIGSHKGYKYYGRARDLPGIKELFSELAPPPKTKRSKQDLLKLKLDRHYYGHDYEDDALLEYESAREAEALANLENEPDQMNRLGGYTLPTIDDVPDQAAIEAMVMHARKEALLAKYA